MKNVSLDNDFVHLFEDGPNVRIMSFQQGKFNVEFWMFVLIFQLTLKTDLKSISLKIISFELKHPYNTLKVPQISTLSP